METVYSTEFIYEFPLDKKFFCYHHDICIVLKSVMQERRSENPVNVKKNRLAGRSGWFGWGTGCYFVLSAILFIYPLLTKTNLISDDAIKELTDIPVMILMAINFIISLISFMKYLSLRICVRNFQKVHKWYLLTIKSKKNSIKKVYVKIKV